MSVHDDGEYQGDPPADALRRLYRGAAGTLACGHPVSVAACTHPVGCLRDGVCAVCVAVQDARLHLEERDAAREEAHRDHERLAEMGAALLHVVAERAALAAHVGRLRAALERLTRVYEADAEPDTEIAPRPPWLTAALAATPAASLDEHDRGVRAAALREAVEELRALGIDPCLWAGVMLARADAIERGEP